MIKATYKQGGQYLCPSLDHINLRIFTLDDIATLQVGHFTYDEAQHGELLYQGLRTGKDLYKGSTWRLYVLVTDKFKIFVFGGGQAVILRDWVKGHVYYDECKPGAAARVRMLRKSMKEAEN